jgi:glycosyltransferase involved in cell wall biosynthesis
MKNKISVLMTVYNAEKFIAEAIRSIINQSYKNWNLFIVDDKSNDRSIEIIKKKFKNKKIKLIKLNKHIGRTNALIVGLKKCTGEFTAIMDADDISHTDRFKNQIKFLCDNNEVKMVGSWIYKIDEYSKKFGTLKPLTDRKKLSSDLLFLNTLSHSSLMFDTKLAKKFKGYPAQLKYAQDYGLILKFLSNTKLAVISKFLIYNRFQKKSMTYTKVYQKQIVKDQIYLIKYVKKNFDLNLKQLLKYYILRIKFLFKAVKYFFS